MTKEQIQQQRISRIGQKCINNQGVLMEIIQYNSYSNISIRFEDGTIVHGKSYAHFQNRTIKNPNYNINTSQYKYGNKRIGERNTNSIGLKMKIIAYRNSNDIDIEFENGYVANNKTYSSFIKGNVKNYTHPILYGIGYLGSEYAKNLCKHEDKNVYYAWKAMLSRVYDKKQIKLNINLQKNTMCSQWECFENFAKWYIENFYSIDDEIMCLDKDILIHGNTHYSPETCLIVPNRINLLFIKQNSNRGKFPIGVTYCSKTGRYTARCKLNDNYHKHIGVYDTPEDAFLAYKFEKEKYIKEVADEYKDKIPKKLYNALYMYEVEITD